MTLNKEDMKALTDKYAKMCGENDTVEQNLFAEYGVKVVRFSNLEVEKNFQGVCTAIDLTVKARMQALIST